MRHFLYPKGVPTADLIQHVQYGAELTFEHSALPDVLVQEPEGHDDQTRRNLYARISRLLDRGYSQKLWSAL